RIIGINCTLGGVIVVAHGEKTPDENNAATVQSSGRGIGLAVFAAVGFAVLFWLLGIRVIPRVGAIPTVWMIRLTSSLLTAAVILVSRQPMRLPRGDVRWMALGMGAFDTGAFVLSNFGMKIEAVPVTLRGTVQPGSRVLVPFRKKAMVGVVVEMAESAPHGTKIRELTGILDFVPALTPKLIELSNWIAGYYLAPTGEVFRAMLPPVTELKSHRQIILTDAGREAVDSSGGGELSPGLTPEETAFLSKLKEKKGTLPLGPAARWGTDPSGLQRLRRRGLIELRETVQG